VKLTAPSPYTIAYAAAWAVGAVGIIAGVLAGSVVTPLHPNWLTPDIAGTAALVSAGCIGLESILPQINRTPQAREEAYLAAHQGTLPKDLARKYKTLIARRERPTDPSVPGPGV
jgi:hypothetical protein